MVTLPNYIQILCCIFVLLILISNGILIYHSKKKESKLTELDKLMCLDSVLCMLSSITLIRIATRAYFNNLFLCYFVPFVIIFCNHCKIFLTMGIALYRYVSVVKYSWIQNSKQRKLFISIIMSTMLMLALIMTGLAAYYKDHWISFLGMYP